MTEGDPDGLLVEVQHHLHALQRRVGLALWEMATTGAEAAMREVERAELERATLLGDRSRFRAAERGLDRADPGSPRARQLHLLRLQALPFQASPQLREEIIAREVELEGTFGAFRARFEGRRVPDNVLDQVLLDETSESRRREAWEATRDVGREVADTVRRLTELRNRAARELGFPTHLELALETAELDPERLDTLLVELERRSRRAHTAHKREHDQLLARRYGVEVDRLRPWHYTDRFHQRLGGAIPDLDRAFSLDAIERNTRATFAAVGLDIDELWAASDMFPRLGKQQHAFCLGIAPPDDVRVLANLEPGTRWMSTCLHEFGHAAYDRHLPRELATLERQAAHPATTEAVAMLFGRLVHDRRWLEQVAEVDPATAARGPDRLRREQVVFLRWALVVVRFEQQLFRDPGGDLDAVWWELVERMQGLSKPRGRREPDWAAKIHIACYPAYYHNYILGELMASQLTDAVTTPGSEPHGLVLDAELGDLLRRLFALGTSRPWESALECTTGRPLTTGPFEARFLGGH